MTKIRKRHVKSFKVKVALEAIKEQKTASELCQEFGITSSQIYSWKKQLEEGAESIFEDKRQVDNKQDEVDKLHRIIGKITAERDFLDRALKR